MKIILSICFLLAFMRANGQSLSTDMTLITEYMNAQTMKQKGKIKIQKSLNPVKQLLFVPLFFYQKILSAQISAVCEFDKSCSNFSIQAIREFGFLKGICLTADRLTRCNGQAQMETENYLINHHHGKVIDLPSMYHFKN